MAPAFTADELRERVAAMPAFEAVRILLKVAAGMERPLTWKQQRFVEEYAVDCNAERAARAAGYTGHKPRVQRYFRNPGYAHVQAAIAMKLVEHAARSSLTAEYVRDYIHDVLELTPTDYFVLTEEGDWVIDPAEFKKLPVNVKRLVDDVEVSFYRDRVAYKVKFLSKAAALAMAAKYTLTQKVAATVTTIPWDDLVADTGAEDAIERRIADAAAGIEGPAETWEGALAGGDVLRQAEGDNS